MLRESLAVLLCAAVAYGLLLLIGWPGNACQAVAADARAPMQWIVGSRC